MLLDISALGGEYCLAVEMLGQSNTVLVRNGDYETLPRNSLTMGRDEFMVLAQVDGQRTVAEIGAASGLEEITVISILGKLAEAGVLLVKAERQSRAEDDVELQAHRDSVWAEVSQLLDDIAEEPGAAPAGAAGPQADAAALDWSESLATSGRRRARASPGPAGRKEEGRAALPAARPLLRSSPVALRPPAHASRLAVRRSRP